MNIEKKYKKLGEVAQQIIRIDGEIFKAIHAGDVAGEQVALVNRSILVAKVQTLIDWQGVPRKGVQFE